MNSIAVRILAAVSIIEAIIIALLIANRHLYCIMNQLSSIPAEPDLFGNGLTPNERFEQVVKQNGVGYHIIFQSNLLQF